MPVLNFAINQERKFIVGSSTTASGREHRAIHSANGHYCCCISSIQVERLVLEVKRSLNSRPANDRF